MNYPARILKPSENHLNKNRKWQGVPTIEKTGNRLWSAWFSGGKYEPSPYNYITVAISDDDGKSWKEPIFVIEGILEEHFRVFDPELWLDDTGKLWLYWCQDTYAPDAPCTDYDTPSNVITDYYFQNLEQWGMFCENPEDENPVWSKPQFMLKGLAKNKPITLDDGSIIMVTHDTAENTEYSGIYAYISNDMGKSFSYLYTIVQCEEGFCEPMAVRLNDGSLWCLIRTVTGYLFESYSKDNGKTWTPAQKTDIPNPSTRFYLGRLPGGELLFINTPSDVQGDRTGMIVSVFEDGCKTPKYNFEIDDRKLVSYPDVALADNGSIYIIYDCQRDNRHLIDKNNSMRSETVKEILYAKVTIDDIKAGKLVSPESKLRQLISKVHYDERKLG